MYLNSMKIVLMWALTFRCSFVAEKVIISTVFPVIFLGMKSVWRPNLNDQRVLLEWFKSAKGRPDLASPMNSSAGEVWVSFHVIARGETVTSGRLWVKEMGLWRDKSGRVSNPCKFCFGYLVSWAFILKAISPIFINSL